jgi:light-regulated signal transduction histidine kinase (bacteriophytochrome)
LFSCADNGIGIEAEYAERIFVIFQRLHTREAYDGTGIGLAMCRKIVEHHGGRMWLDQSYTGGTRMCFTLPADPSAKPIGGSEE